MSDNANFNRLSTYVGGIVDRKVKAISMAITGSGSYLRALTTQTQGYANDALGYVNAAAGHASDAATAASSSLIVWNSFTSTYLGLASSDPVISGLGNTISVGAFYIRSSDNRLRVCRSIGPGNVPVWADATVQADLTSLSGAGVGIFLGLNINSNQNVVGPVTFQNTVLVPRVVSWTSQQPATAVDVNERVSALQTNINAADTRAVNAEAALNSSKVAKIGDTMTGALTIATTGDASSVTVRNTTASTGRQYRINSANDGVFRIVDDTSTIERLRITNAGAITLNGSVQVNNGVTSTAVAANNAPATDPSFLLQTNGVTRWTMARSASSSRFYIARMNSTGVFIDSPISISENDGSLTLNRTIINDTLTTSGRIRINSSDAVAFLNNSSGLNDPGIALAHLGNIRWYAGRSASLGAYFINRYTDTGVLIDTPFRIAENNGLTTVTSLQSSTTIQASTSVTAPQVFVTASGTGRNIQIGDDAWIGDSNIANGLTIRGVQDFNAGFIRFGNSNTSLGCSGDNVLKYGNETVYHTGNFNINNFGFDYGTTNGVDWSKRPAGNGKIYVKMSGYMTFNQQRVAQVVTYPFPLEKIMDYQVSNVIPGDSVDRDQLAQFVNAPTLTQVRVVMQETAGQSGYPIGVRWSVEGIQA